MTVEDWAEIRRLHRVERMPIKAIVRTLGVSRNAVRRALARDEPPKYERPAKGSVVDAVVKLAHALGLKVVAEGIENERQRVILTELGCDELQGFLFAKPMTARALLLWAMEDKQDHAEHFASSLFVSTYRQPVMPLDLPRPGQHSVQRHDR